MKGIERVEELMGWKGQRNERNGKGRGMKGMERVEELMGWKGQRNERDGKG